MPPPGSPATALVLSVSHSGSTALDLALGTHPEIVGLGEVYNFARKRVADVRAGEERLCSCMRSVSECELWGPVVAQIEPDSNRLVRDVYELAKVRFEALYGPGTVLLDSSKKLEALDLLSPDDPSAVPVIFLVRDVRSWVAGSRHRLASAGGRPGRRSPIGTAKRSVVDSTFGLTWRWAHHNQRLLEDLRSRGNRFLLVSYERLCFEPSRVVSEIALWLGLSARSQTPDLTASKSHATSGNRMRLDPAARASIAYDARWLERNDWMPAYVLMRRARRLNDELVWGHAGRSS